jgi:ATP-dependent Clp protease protease subunit
MAKCEDYEIDINDLAEALVDNVKEDIKTFDDLINLEAALNREIVIGEITSGLGSYVAAYIEYWNQKDKNIPIEDREPIKLIIDSPGGFLTDSLTIIDAIKLSKTPVYGICTGCAYSGGFFIFISCDERFAYPHASFLFHEGATSNGGTSGQFQNYAAFYKKQLDQLKDIVVSNTKITAEEYKEIKKDDIWYDVNEAIEKGIVDQIMEEFI